LKTFLTQIGLTLLLTSDPPVICFCKWIGWKDYEVPKNRNLESVSAKNVIFFSPMSVIPAVVPVGPTCFFRGTPPSSKIRRVRLSRSDGVLLRMMRLREEQS
jgi:hypothetical protein